MKTSKTTDENFGETDTDIRLVTVSNRSTLDRILEPIEW